MSDQTPIKLNQIRPIEQVDEFLVVERVFSEDGGLPSVGLANIHAEVPNIEANKEKILRACQIFKERGANLAIFPEFCLSGYFWEDEAACWDYMNEAATENHRDWVDGTLKSLLDNQFTLIIMNNISRVRPANSTTRPFLFLGWTLTTLITRIPTTRFSCPVLRRPTRRRARMIA